MNPRGTGVDPDDLVAQRRERLADVMRATDVAGLLTADPFTIRYLTGTRNMLVHGMTGPDRLALFVLGGPTVLWEFAGCEHLSESAAHVGEVRPAPGLSAKKTPNYREEIQHFAKEIAYLLGSPGGHARDRLGLDGLGPFVADELRTVGLEVTDGGPAVQTAMAVKQPLEIDAMNHALRVAERAAAHMEEGIMPGRTEQEVWAEFHRHLIAEGGELVVTRLLQAGARTFPYFEEASDHTMSAGDLVCFDSDAVSAGGYSADFSRTFLCGDGSASATQRHLYSLALEQLEHNAANLAPGRTYAEFAESAYVVPSPHADYGYYQLAHGLGLLGGQPNIPRAGPEPYPLPGGFEPGMVICVESYVGDPGSGQGVKLENQYLICERGVEQMSSYPLDQRLGVTP